jgi:diguanylate cyclase (GGDEF)-like protein/PAS domain S-box-containing protein
MGERELSSDAWSRRYLDHMQDLIVVIDMATGVVIDINDAGAAGLLHRPDEILGLVFHDFVHEDDRTQFAAIKQNLLEGRIDTYRQRWRRGDQTWGTYEVYTRLVEENRLLVCGRDATSLAESEARNDELHTLVDLTNDLFIVSDERNVVRYANSATVRLHGDSVLRPGARVTDYLWGPDDLDALISLTSAVESDDHRASTRLSARREDGSRVELWVSTVYDPEKQLWYTVERDITDTVAAENRLKKLNEGLEELANTDTLTGLANRARLNSVLEQSVVDGSDVAVLLIDIDDFKIVNDSLGHQHGDELLRQTADRLRNCAEVDDLIARFGGDEFVIVLQNPRSVARAVDIADSVLAALEPPFHLADRTIHSAASIGIAFSSDRASTAAELLRDADLAMYRAKHEGRNRLVVFDAGLVEELDERIRTIDELRVALANDEIDVALQGIFCAQSGSLVGYEALVRWIHPTRGFVPPDTFVELAESEGLLDGLTDIVLEKSLARLADWLQETDHTLSVNVAPSQLLSPDFAGRIRAQLERFGLEPSCLVIEITEVGLTGALAAADATLQELQRAGFTLAIDDFGKGASSLGYLRDFPIGMVKIDGSFIHRMLEDDFAHAITESVVALARRLGLVVVAECVETQEQHDHLQRMGCERLQGYLLHKPQLAGELDGELRSAA